jgi:hypothetical protein
LASQTRLATAVMKAVSQLTSDSGNVVNILKVPQRTSRVVSVNGGGITAAFLSSEEGLTTIACLLGPTLNS